MIKILLIDDSEVNNLLLCEILKDKNYDIIHVEIPGSAFMIYEQEKPDLIILDLLMQIHGFRILEQIRQISDVPVFILTCVNDSKVMMDALEKGANEYLLKPICSQLLIDKLKKYI